MRIIHTRQRVFKKDNAFQHKFTLLIWILSILKWKQYNNEVVLYADTETLNDIRRFGFDHLYDEIDSVFLENDDTCKKIDKTMYWAMSKLLALRHEVLDLNNKAVVVDQDVVPTSDVSRLWTNSDVAVWSNREFAEIGSIYPKLYNLSLPDNYKLPWWFTGNAKPLNTGILHIKDKNILKLYVNEAVNMALDNKNRLNNSICQTMCNVEQRLLGEVVEYKKLSYSVMQPMNQGLFNRNGFHTHGYKSRIGNNGGINWNITALKMIEQLDSEMYNKLIENPFFEREKKAIESNRFKLVDELKQYM